MNWCANYQLKAIKLNIWLGKLELSQAINEPMRMLDSSSSCIDPVFPSQPNLDVESESDVHP